MENQNEWFVAGARTFPPVLGYHKEYADVAWLRKHAMSVWDTVCMFDDGGPFSIADVADAITEFHFPHAAPSTNYKRAALILRSVAAEGGCIHRLDSKRWAFK